MLSVEFAAHGLWTAWPHCGIPGYRARIRPIVSRITIHWPSFYNVVTGKTLALPNLIALQHIPLSPAGVIAKRPAPIALPNSCAAEWRMAPDAVFSPYASVRYFTPHMVHSQYNLLWCRIVKPAPTPANTRWREPLAAASNITSYNVCYTKLLAMSSDFHCSFHGQKQRKETTEAKKLAFSTCRFLSFQRVF